MLKTYMILGRNARLRGVLTCTTERCLVIETRDGRALYFDRLTLAGMGAARGRRVVLA